MTDPGSKPLWDDLLTAFLGSGPISIAVVWLGFYVNRSIEKLKSEESLNAGMTDIKLKKVGEVSETAYAWESEVALSIGQLKRMVGLLPPAARSEFLNQSSSDLKRLADDGRTCRSTLARNRFWIGDRLYDAYASFFVQVLEKLESIRDVSSLEKFDVVLRDAHVDVTQAMEAFITDHAHMRKLWAEASRNN